MKNNIEIERKLNKLTAKVREIDLERRKNWHSRILLELDSRHCLLRSGFTEKEIKKLLPNYEKRNQNL